MHVNEKHSQNSSEASSAQPCQLCGRENYCYQISDVEEITKIVCHSTSPDNPPPGWQYAGTAKDNRPIFTKEGYKRKRRSKKSKYPELIELNPQELSDIPQWQDVHIPLNELRRGHIVQLKPGAIGNPNQLYEFDKWESAGKGKGLLAVLTLKDGLGGELKVPESDISAIATWDASGKEQFIEYYYSETQKVVRTQWTDRREVYGGKSKKVRPYHKQGEEWKQGKGERPFPLYRFDEGKTEILNQGIVFVVGGEPKVEAFRTLGLIATCNSGGETNLRQIAADLAQSFQLANNFAAVDQDIASEEPDLAEYCSERKPLLVIWPDNDDTGKIFSQKLLKECWKHKITAVVINPLNIWAEMPPKGDIVDWLKHCSQVEIPKEEIYRRLEFAIDAAIDAAEQEALCRWQRDQWNAPGSHNGEIGYWKQDKDGNRKWEPACNFDFVVERELKDSCGGGIVLKIKRSFEQREYRVILNSCDYTKPDTFTDALKRALGTGIVCNLTKKELNALIHVRLHEYRTNRSGKVFKRIDRYGQQEDGTWVFGDRQYTLDGKLTSEETTEWVFNPNLGKDDFIPCPEQANREPLQAVKQLINTARQFYGQCNIHQVLLTIGWTVAGLHSQSIFKLEGRFPIFNAYGDPGSCKTLAFETALSLIGKNWPEEGMLARVSTSALYEHGSRTGSLPFVWDDPERSSENEELAKTWYNWKPRKVRGNEQIPHSPMGITSNHVFGGDQLATYTRCVRVPFERATGTNKESFQALKAAQQTASGAFPLLLNLGYPKEAIARLEDELIHYLPDAHVRIAQSLAIVTYYAQKVVELTGGTENIKRWVIDHLCHSENDADSTADSLADFIAKICSLESQSLIGDWNKRVVTKDERSYIAIHPEDVWGLVDRQFRPATYNKKSIKALILKAGGLEQTVRFAKSKDQVLAYERVLLTEEPAKKPEQVTRKAWLIPSDLFPSDDNGEDTSTPPIDGFVTDATSCNQSLVTASNPDGASVLVPINNECNHVTKKKELIINQDFEPIVQIKESLGAVRQINTEIAVTTGYAVTDSPDTEINQELQAVTNSEQSSGYNTQVVTTAPAILLAEALEAAKTWAEVEAATIGFDQSSKEEAWKRLTDSQKTRIKALEPGGLRFKEGDLVIVLEQPSLGTGKVLQVDRWGEYEILLESGTQWFADRVLEPEPIEALPSEISNPITIKRN